MTMALSGSMMTLMMGGLLSFIRQVRRPMRRVGMMQRLGVGVHHLSCQEAFASFPHLASFWTTRPTQASSSATRRLTVFGSVGSFPTAIPNRIGAMSGWSHSVAFCRCDGHGAKCAKRRAIGDAQQSELGVWQPIAYLMVWASRAQEFADRASHLRFVPTLQEQRDWINAHRRSS